jgi:UDP-N-acetylmuramyl tripeptide synthase
MARGIGPVDMAAIAAGKAAGASARLLRRGGGTALPGLVAERVSPRLLRRFARQLRQGAIVVTGTNGKTTTSRMLDAVLAEAGWRLIHNRSGSNLVRGLVATLVQASDLRGDLRADAGLFEVDEATIPAVVAQVRPRLILINNHFRDQLDRYGELDTIHRQWRAALATLPEQTRVVLNADDPSVAVLAQHTRARVITYGIADTRHALTALPHAADAINCPLCAHRLVYETILLSHLGHYHCPQCGFARPPIDVAATEVALHGAESLALTVHRPAGTFAVEVGVPGFYNAYNALGATAAALALGIAPAAIQAGLRGFRAAFGRIEPVPVGDKQLLLALVKNPVGFNEVLRMLFPPGTPAADGPKHLLIIINDLTADGRDVSWLWDVDFELLGAPGATARVTTAGLRAPDMANRLKYAGVDPTTVTAIPTLDAALDAALAALPRGATLYVLPTYTAMLAFRDLLHHRGWVGQFWEQ